MKRRQLMLASAGVLLALPTLQACFPLIAAGVGTGVIATVDRRTYGAQVEDTEIEVRSRRELTGKFGNRVSLSTTSFNRWLLITGRIDSEASKAEATQLARNVPNVRHVINELAVVNAVSNSLSNYSTDVALTTKVKTRLIDGMGNSANSVKVVSESSVVYLLGLVTQREADHAVEIARTTNGAMRVVHAFELISPEEAQRLDKLSNSQSAPAAR